MNIEYQYPFWAWVIFFASVLIALGVDLGIANRKSHAPTRRETFVWSSVWISLALGFNVFVYWLVSNHGQYRVIGTSEWMVATSVQGLSKATEFLTGYLIELSLSVDNLFVFLLIFGYFKVPKKYQHRVLFWGIMGALVMRMIMIFTGAELVERFHWILYVFGAFLIWTGLKMFSDDEEGFHPEDSKIVTFITRYVRITKHYDKSKFLIKVDGKTTGTLLLLVLIVVELSDLMFAIDSIPAIFGITTDKFIVYTSNIFAILGLRTFFFLLADLADRFHFLKFGLAFILTFIGVKMLLPLLAEGLIIAIGHDHDSAFATFLQRFINHEFSQQFINISLGVVLSALSVSIILSLIFPKSDKTQAE